MSISRPLSPTIAKNPSRQESSSYRSATSVSVCPFSLLISFCFYRPLSHLLYSLHRGESTHLPSRRATPLPSISSHSPLGGDWYQHPPSFVFSLSTPSSLYTFSTPLSLLLWHLLFLPLYLWLPPRLTVFNLHSLFPFDFNIKQIVCV